MSEDRIAEVAAKHGFSREAAQALYAALARGPMAQFDHPELGGLGQWMPGMIQIGKMFDAELKGRVASLAGDLEALVRGGTTPGVSATMRPMEPMKPIEAWWPEEFGRPNAAGGQDDVLYAYFAGLRRLVVRRGAQTTIYETGDHRIGGVSQQQGSDRRDVVFTSQHGPVPLSSLKVVPTPGA